MKTNIWKIGTLNQLFLTGSFTQIKTLKKLVVSKRFSL